MYCFFVNVLNVVGNNIYVWMIDLICAGKALFLLYGEDRGETGLFKTT